ncbi:MAG: hypothetical protein ACI9KE_001144 [Polyangiales bacterium]|jgi:hypothetical protein
MFAAAYSAALHWTKRCRKRATIVHHVPFNDASRRVVTPHKSLLKQLFAKRDGAVDHRADETEEARKAHDPH